MQATPARRRIMAWRSPGAEGRSGLSHVSLHNAVCRADCVDNVSHLVELGNGSFRELSRSLQFTQVTVVLKFHFGEGGVCGGTYLAQGLVEVKFVRGQGEIELQLVGVQPANRPGGDDQAND